MTHFIAFILIYVATLMLSLTGKPPPFWASWGDQFKKSTTDFNSNAQGWVKGMENRAKTIQMPRWEMPGAGSSIDCRYPLSLLPDLSRLTVLSLMLAWRFCREERV